MLGDIHGDVVALRALADRAIDGMGLTRVVVSVGDFGLGPWGGRPVDKILKRADDLLERLGAYLLLTPGNHDNWDTIDRAVTFDRDAQGFEVLGQHGRVRVSPRGHRFDVGGRRFGSLGGAVSVDRGPGVTPAASASIVGKSWWPQEAPTTADLDVLRSESLDVLITHDAPAGIPLTSQGDWEAALIEKATLVQDLLREAVERTTPQLVVCGHWHQRVSATVTRRDGGMSRVEVLGEEHTPGNSVMLNLDDLTVESLPERWRDHHNPTVNQ